MQPPQANFSKRHQNTRTRPYQDHIVFKNVSDDYFLDDEEALPRAKPSVQLRINNPQQRKRRPGFQPGDQQYRNSRGFKYGAGPSPYLAQGQAASSHAGQRASAKQSQQAAAEVWVSDPELPAGIDEGERQELLNAINNFSNM